MPTEINLRDQILLDEQGNKMENKRQVGSLPNPVTLFLYNRQMLTGGSVHSSVQLPRPMDVEGLEIQLPVVGPGPHLSPALLNNNSPAVRNLPSYERQFYTHVVHANHYIGHCKYRLSLTHNYMGYLNNQLLALQVAIKNLNGHAAHLTGKYDEFTGHFKQQESVQLQLLESFEHDLGRLRSIDLHPALQSNNRNTLLDCISENKLRKYKQDCCAEHHKIQQMVSQLHQRYEAVQLGMRQINEPVIIAELDAIRNMLNSFVAEELHAGTAQDSNETQHNGSQVDAAGKPLAEGRLLTYVKWLESDHQRAVHCLNAVEAELQQNHGAIVSFDIRGNTEALEDISKRHYQEIMKEFDGADQKLKNVMLRLNDVQRHIRQLFTEKLGKVSALSSDVRSIESTIPLFAEAMKRLEQGFTKFNNLKLMPAAYHAALWEVTRRKAFRTIFSLEAKDTAERLTKLTDEERPKRERYTAELRIIACALSTCYACVPGLMSFLSLSLLHLPVCSFHTQHGQYLPSGLFPALADSAPFVELKISDTDTALPNITLDTTVLNPERKDGSPDTVAASLDAYSWAGNHNRPLASPTASSSSASSTSSSASSLSSDAKLARLEAENTYLKAELAMKNNGVVPALPTQSPNAAGAAVVTDPAALSSKIDELTKLLQEAQQRAADAELQVQQKNDKIHTLSASATSSTGALSAPAASAEAALATSHSELSQHFLAVTKKLKHTEQLLNEKEQELGRTCAELELKIHKEASRAAELQRRVSELVRERDLLSAQLKQSKEEHVALCERTVNLMQKQTRLSDEVDEWKEIATHLISYESIQLEHLVLFRKNNNGFYAAFNARNKHYFLDEHIKAQFERAGVLHPYVVARVVSMDSEQLTTDVDNPFQLQVGTPFTRLTCELIGSWEFDS